MNSSTSGSYCKDADWFTTGRELPEFRYRVFMRVYKLSKIIDKFATKVITLIFRSSREFIIFEFRDDIMQQISCIINEFLLFRIFGIEKNFNFSQSKLIIVEIRGKQDILSQGFLFSCCDKC